MSSKGREGIMKIYSAEGTIYIQIQGECFPAEWIYAMEKAKIQILSGDAKSQIEKFARKVGGGPIG